MSDTTDPKLALATLAVMKANPSLDVEQAETVAKAALAAAPAPEPKPAVTPVVDTKPVPAAGPPAAPKLPDMTGLSPNERYVAWREHEKKMENWIPMRQSYIDPVDDARKEAKQRLHEMRNLPETDSPIERAARATERERLMSVVLGGA